VKEALLAYRVRPCFAPQLLLSGSALAAAPKQFPQRIPETFLLQDNPEKVMKMKYDSKVAESVNLQRENEKIKKDLQEKEKEIKLLRVRARDRGEEGRERREENGREKREIIVHAICYNGYSWCDRLSVSFSF